MFPSIDTHICQQHQGHTYREKSGLAFMVQKGMFSSGFVCCYWFKKTAQKSWHQQVPLFSPPLFPPHSSPPQVSRDALDFLME